MQQQGLTEGGGGEGGGGTGAAFTAGLGLGLGDCAAGQLVCQSAAQR